MRGTRLAGRAWGALACVGLVAAVACSTDGPTAADEQPRPLGPSELASAWAGDYWGDGTGQVDGDTFTVKNARLRVTLPGDSAARAACPACVTVSLDSVFMLADVPVTDPAELTLTYDAGAVRHTLLLVRDSSTVRVGNGVAARVTLGQIGVSTFFYDITYLLERS